MAAFKEPLSCTSPAKKIPEDSCVSEGVTSDLIYFKSGSALLILWISKKVIVSI